MLVPQATRGFSHAVGTDAVQIANRARDETNTRSQVLEHYLEGWAEANPAKIFAATAQDYCFNDPLVGRFSRWSVRTYLERLRWKFGRAGATTVADLAIFIRGPMDGSRPGGPLEFFREAPRLGLTGVTFITVGDDGVISESVAYDLNLASNMLRVRA